MSSWQDIATSPRDGTPVLVAIAGEVFYPCSAWWDRADGRWAIAQTARGVIGLTEQPTHWQPLPEPPTTPESSR